ncbi:MAG: DUF4382 domain-containing protein [Planctomycetota bacterium]|jgi:hypothetical protein
MRRAILLCALLAACGEPDFWAFSSNTSGTQGTRSGFTAVAIWISDSPVDTAEAVRVTIDGVDLIGAKHRRLSTARHDLDLLELRNGRAARLASTEVEAGLYDRLRLYLAGGEVRAGGRTHPLRLAQSHVDLDGPFLLRDGEGIELHIDFNVRMSVLEADGAWTLTPRLSLVEAGAAAVVSGAVDPPAATVSAQQAGTEIASTRTDPDGAFRLGPLPAGTYALVVTAPGHAPEVERGVALHAGATAAGHVFHLAPAATGAVHGLAPSGTLVVRVLRDGALVAVAGVSAAGDFALASLPAGSYDVEYHDGAGLVATDRIDVDP